MAAMSRLHMFLATAILAYGLLAIASPSPSHAQSTLQAIQERGKLLAGVRFDAPPLGYVDAQGNNVGFGPDLAREFAKHLGVEVEFVQVTSKARIPLLINGLIDAEIGGTTPTKARDEVIDFAYLYVVDQSVVLVRKGESANPEDYFNSDKVAGAVQGSFYVDLWKHYAPDATIREYQEFTDVVLALAQGQVDVVPATTFVGPDIIEQLGERTSNLMVGGTFFEDIWAIGLRENDSDWRDWVNWALQRMWADGRFQALYRQHFNAEPAFNLGDSGRLQPGVEQIAQESDPW